MHWVDVTSTSSLVNSFGLRKS